LNEVCTEHPDLCQYPFFGVCLVKRES
jgi:hypothetical protein